MPVCVVPLPLYFIELERHTGKIAGPDNWEGHVGTELSPSASGTRQTMLTEDHGALERNTYGRCRGGNESEENGSVIEKDLSAVEVRGVADRNSSTV